jgi:hypothetical protein
MFKIIENKDPKLCKAYRCENPRSKKDRFCPKHRSRYYKETNPVAYTYNLRKQRAKERGHEWNLSLEEFREFCEETGYIEKTGKKAGSASLDRIKAHIGYEKGNLQILPLADNTAKHHKEKNCPF